MQTQEYKLIIKAYEPPCWSTEVGASKMYSIYSKRGLPNIIGWKFLTLTADPSKYCDEEDAYEKCNRHIRQFLYLLRKKYGYFEFMKKVEFHKSGYVHFHLLISLKEKLDLDFIKKIWGKGRTQTKNIQNKSAQKALDYLFKYACKKQDLPDWVASRKNFRFVAFSKNFFTDKKPATKKESTKDNQKDKNDKPQKRKNSALSIKDRIRNWSRCAIISFSRNGETLYNRVKFREDFTWKDFLHTALNLKIYYNANNKGLDFGVFYKEVFMNNISHFLTFVDEHLLEVPEFLKKSLSPYIYLHKGVPPMGYPF